MNCDVCTNIIKNKSPLFCTYCNKHFCSKNCYQNHSISYHKILNKNIPPEKHTPPFSKYITEGSIIPKIIYDSTYDLKNFTSIKENNSRKIIGSGSYGKVYLVRNIINKKLYAIKHMLKSDLKLSLNSFSRIYNEINIQSKIKHQNIISLLYVKETKNSFYLVMDYANSGSLFELIQKNKGLDEKKAFLLFIQVVNAIFFLHKNDIIHRDIKPENILIFNNNICKLCDFGCCVKLNGGTRVTFIGTTEYMSPEIVNKKNYSKEIDVWALGILLYEMLHGYSPFIPKKKYFYANEVIKNIKLHCLKFNENVSLNCKELILHLLDMNSESRYKVEDIFESKFVKYYENMKEKKEYCDKKFNIYEVKKLILNKKNNYDKKPIVIRKQLSKSKLISRKKENILDNLKKINNKTAENFYTKISNESREKLITEINNSMNEVKVKKGAYGQNTAKVNLYNKKSKSKITDAYLNNVQINKNNILNINGKYDLRTNKSFAKNNSNLKENINNNSYFYKNEENKKINKNQFNISYEKNNNIKFCESVCNRSFKKIPLINLKKNFNSQNNSNINCLIVNKYHNKTRNHLNNYSSTFFLLGESKNNLKQSSNKSNNNFNISYMSNKINNNSEMFISNDSKKYNNISIYYSIGPSQKSKDKSFAKNKLNNGKEKKNHENKSKLKKNYSELVLKTDIYKKNKVKNKNILKNYKTIVTEEEINTDEENQMTPKKVLDKFKFCPHDMIVNLNRYIQKEKIK